MNIGTFSVELLSEGIFEVLNDGIFTKMDSDFVKAHKTSGPEHKKPTYIGIDPVLIQKGSHNILIDTGLGWGLDHTSAHTQSSNVRTNLDIFDIHPEDITHIILTHLHYDHAAGCSYVDEHAKTRATFPNALIYVQKREWDFAVSQYGTEQKQRWARYELDEFFKLAAEERIYFIEDDFYTVIPGLNVIWTGGHSPGHQIVHLKDGSASAFFLGDLVPSEFHINFYAMKASDEQPLQSRKMKTLLLRQAYEEHAMLFFYHSIKAKGGHLEMDIDRRFVLVEA